MKRKYVRRLFLRPYRKLLTNLKPFRPEYRFVLDYVITNISSRIPHLHSFLMENTLINHINLSNTIDSLSQPFEVVTVSYGK